MTKKHKVKLKALSIKSPSSGLAYLTNVFNDVPIIVNTQRTYSITITIHCDNAKYEFMKLNFIKNVGSDFLWKD